MGIAIYPANGPRGPSGSNGSTGATGLTGAAGNTYLTSSATMPGTLLALSAIQSVNVSVPGATMGTPVFAAYADGVVTTNPTLVAGVTSPGVVTVSLIALLALITTTTRVVNLRILI